MKDVSRFLDKEGRIKAWPAKQADKVLVLEHLSEKFEHGRFYTEKEVNALIDRWHTFGDYFLLRRGMVDLHLLSRERNGSRYWREEKFSNEDMIRIIMDNYEIGSVISIMQMGNGIGSDAFYILSDKGEFIFKDIEHNHMNHPENEDMILNQLRSDGLPVPQICKTTGGGTLVCDNGRQYHMQSYVYGSIFKPNTAPAWLIAESAEMLGRIQNSMSKLPPLPVGLSQNFFSSLSPEQAVINHTDTLKTARDKGDEDIAEAIENKIKLIQKYRDLKFDFSAMTCANTHGDYSINQIICGSHEIHAVIDFTSSCIHPLCWEVLRSYSLADEKCADGTVDPDGLKAYIDHYSKHGSLNAYDIKVMPEFYMYQHLLSDYFCQYYHSRYRNKELLRKSAMFTYQQCKALDAAFDQGLSIV